MDHERYMRRAVTVAHGNLDAPFGCVIADRETGEVLAEGLNKAERNPISHGEIDAIVHLSAHRPAVDWTRLVLYTNAEPCPMLRGDPMVRHPARRLRHLDTNAQAPRPPANRPASR